MTRLPQLDVQVDAAQRVVHVTVTKPLALQPFRFDTSFDNIKALAATIMQLEVAQAEAQAAAQAAQDNGGKVGLVT